MFGLEGLFKEIFKVLFTLIHNSFITYIIILAVFVSLALYIWKLIKRPRVGKFVTILLILLEGLVCLYVFWFVFIHFHTYRFIK